MTKAGIYDLALRPLGKKCSEADLLLEEKPYEIEMCESFHAQAVLRALREYPWSFFITELDVDYGTDTPAHGFRHGYALPSGMLSLVPEKDAPPFRVIANVYYTDSPTSVLYGIMDGCVDSMDHPLDFDMLVAYSLSYLLCPILAPGDQNASALALQGYSWARGTLMDIEIANSPEMREGPFDHDIVTVDIR